MVLTYGHDELRLLPLKLAWCRHHGLRMVYFDNESTDGSREWAVENGVFAGDIATDGAFDIAHIVGELERHRQGQRYDWCLLAGVDLFLSGTGEATIAEYLRARTGLRPEVDGIMADYAMICRVTDVGPLDPTRYDRYCILRRDLTLVARGTCALGVDLIECARPEKGEGLWWFNFGHTKPREERRETYRRRVLAWERGLGEGLGQHYRVLASTDFTTPPEASHLVHEMEASEAYDRLVRLLRELARGAGISLG